MLAAPLSTFRAHAPLAPYPVKSFTNFHNKTTVGPIQACVYSYLFHSEKYMPIRLSCIDLPWVGAGWVCLKETFSHCIHLGGALVQLHSLWWSLLPLWTPQSEAEKTLPVRVPAADKKKAVKRPLSSAPEWKGISGCGGDALLRPQPGPDPSVLANQALVRKLGRWGQWACR